MTEEAYFSSAAQKEAFAELGVEQYEIIATLDTHTSDICRSLDGKVYPMKDYQAGVTAPPFHVWCRSTTAPYFADDFGEIGERAARDEEGKTYYVPADTTFEQWKQMQDEKYGAGSVDKLRQMAYNESADRKQYENYRSRLGSKAVKSFEDFQQIKYTAVDAWEKLKAAYRYVNAHEGAQYEHYLIYSELKSMGIRRGYVLPNDHMTAFILKDETAKRDPYHIMHRMMKRNITDDEVREFRDSAKVMFSQRNGIRQAYFSEKGVSIITQNPGGWVFRTTWRKEDFDDIIIKILEVINKYV